MSYCRFGNTLNDLRDCYENMDDECSEHENKKRALLIDLCHDIAESYEKNDQLPVEKN
jgi:hypothetical protein